MHLPYVKTVSLRNDMRSDHSNTAWTAYHDKTWTLSECWSRRLDGRFTGWRWFQYGTRQPLIVIIWRAGFMSLGLMSLPLCQLLN